MFCKKCGKEIEEGVKFCPSCGESVEETIVKAEVVGKEEHSTMKLIAFIFAIIATITSAAAIIPLCWTIPMTVSIYKAYENEKDLSTGFKVCTLIFLSLVSGILLLCDED